MNISTKLVTVQLFLVCWCSANLVLNLQRNDKSYVSLPRFWTGSGLSPSAPLPFNRTAVTQQLLNHDMFINMEYVAALPNSGIKHIRIHWLLSLVAFKGFDVHNIPMYDFDDLDMFLDHLIANHLFPVIEFMGDIFPKNKFYDTRYMWKDFAYQMVAHYLSRYGQWILLNFRFELWNEPDLHTYNILNFTLTQYLDYVHGVRGGLDAAARRMRPFTNIPLRGPAGLFKSIEKHPFCWGLLDHCNANTSICPIDVITFHRKGINRSSDILTETIALLNIIHKNYSNLKGMPFANTEADPTSGWSKNVTSYADVHYAHMLVSIVLQHWNAYLKQTLNRLDSISHDNSFLSFHPFEFDQRTMLARFSMNETHPKSVRFIQKPVYAAFGMLSALAGMATEMQTKENVSYILSLGKNYAAVLLLSHGNSEIDTFKIQLNMEWASGTDATFGYLAEYLDQERTNPYAIWLKYNKPAYPNKTVLAQMLHAQGPHILENPKIIKKESTIRLKIRFHHPWLILVRICAYAIPEPSKVKNLRIYQMDNSTILILWNDYEYPSYERCIRTYEIYYSPINATTNDNPQEMEWKLITKNRHIPFLSYCHQSSAQNPHLEGYYKIRAMDIFGRFSEFSKIRKFQL